MGGQGRKTANYTACICVCGYEVGGGASPRFLHHCITIRDDGIITTTRVSGCKWFWDGVHLSHFVQESNSVFDIISWT